MNKEELEIAKHIAEIEGINVIQHDTWLEEVGIKSGICDYNPFDWAILGPLSLKYEVETVYWLGAVSIEHKTGDNYSIDFNHKSAIPKAILECIIKSKE